MGRRSTPAAVGLTVLIVLGGIVIVIVTFAIADAAAGTGVALVAAIVSEIAVLAFVTARAYPPGAKPPMVRFFVLTLLISVLFPLAYVSWLWVTKKKWLQAGLDPSAASASIPPEATTERGDASQVAVAERVAADDYKTCPDCAEQVRAQARVCRYCGYRFDAEPTPS